MSIADITDVEIAARIAMSELFNVYANALDSKQWLQLENFFTEDATADFPVEQFCNNRLEIIEFIKTALATDEIVTHHMFGDCAVKLKGADGSSAEVEVRMRAYHGGVGAREGLFEESLGSFQGRFVKTLNGWRCSYIKENIFVMLGSPQVFESVEKK